MKFKLLAIPMLFVSLGVAGADLNDKINIQYAGNVSELLRELSGRLEVPYLNMATSAQTEVSINQAENHTVRYALQNINKQISHDGLKISFLDRNSPFQLMVLHYRKHSPEMFLTGFGQALSPQISNSKNVPASKYSRNISEDSQPTSQRTEYSTNNYISTSEHPIHLYSDDIDEKVGKVLKNQEESVFQKMEENNISTSSLKYITRGSAFSKVHKGAILSDGRAVVWGKRSRAEKQEHDK